MFLRIFTEIYSESSPRIPRRINPGVRCMIYFSNFRKIPRKCPTRCQNQCLEISKRNSWGIPRKNSWRNASTKRWRNSKSESENNSTEALVRIKQRSYRWILKETSARIPEWTPDGISETLSKELRNVEGSFFVNFRIGFCLPNFSGYSLVGSRLHPN